MEHSMQPSPDLIVAAIGFLGVLVGAGIAVLGQWLMLKRNEKSERAYVTANLVAALDQLAIDCAAVAFDDGTTEGHPDEDGYHYTQVPIPEFSLPENKANLKHLGADTTYKVLVLPHRIKSIANSVSHEWEHDDPPDFPRTFELRQWSFAVLGKDVAQISSSIRSEHKIPSRPDEIWDPAPSLKEKIEAITARRGKRRPSTPQLGT
jgi:hypothetical protein